MFCYLVGVIVSVVVIEDNPTERALLVRAIQRAPALLCQSHFASYDLAAPELDRLPPNVVLLDLGLPGTPGRVAAERIEKNFPSTKVLVLTGDASEKTILELFAAGAEGYLVKGEPDDRMAQGIWAVHTGRAFWSQQVSEAFRNMTRRRQSLLAALDPRERDVVAAFNRGGNYKSVGAEFGMTLSQLKNCAKTIFRKSFAQSMSQAGFHQGQTAL